MHRRRSIYIHPPRTNQVVRCNMCSLLTEIIKFGTNGTQNEKISIVTYPAVMTGVVILSTEVEQIKSADRKP